MTKIARDKLAHQDCPEFVQIQKELAEYERKALNRFREDYDFKVDSAEKVYVGEIYNIKERARVSSFSSAVPDSSNRSQEQIGEIKQEMFHAARGKYMELVVGRQAAEDDEHTEVRCH
jgi:hypothetical protein